MHRGTAMERSLIQDLRVKADKAKVAAELRDLVTQSLTQLNKESYSKFINNLNLLIFELVSRSPPSLIVVRPSTRYIALILRTSTRQYTL